MKRFLAVAAIAVLTALPAAAGTTYRIDSERSSVGFAVREFHLNKIKGKFRDFRGSVTYDREDPTRSSVDVEIQAVSIDTDIKKRDDHLKSADFLDVEHFPTLTFKSTSIERSGDGFIMNGELKIRGKSHQVSFPFKLFKPKQTPHGERLGASAKLTIDRQRWGVRWKGWSDVVVAGDDVQIELEIQASLAEAE